MLSMLITDLPVISPNCVEAMMSVFDAAYLTRWSVRCSSVLPEIARRNIGRHDKCDVRSLLGLSITTKVECFQAAGKRPHTSEC